MNNKRIFDREIDELKDMILKMGVLVQSLIHKSIDALEKQDVDIAQSVISEGEKVDQLDVEINEKCIQLIALRQPEASDLRFLMTGVRISTDLERIGDLAEDIAQRVGELAEKPLLKPLVDIPKMDRLVENAVSLVLDAFIKKDAVKAKTVWTIEKQVDELRDAVQEELAGIMNKNTDSVPQALPLLLISRHLERICDHATNIAEDVIYMVEGKIVKHNTEELKKIIGKDWKEKKKI
ncbi:MAG: phosphate signaling complex protein PhoU [bacterium]